MDGFVWIQTAKLILVETIFYVSLVIDNQHVLHSFGLFAKQRLFSLFKQFVEIYGTCEAINSQRDTCHDRLLLRDDEFPIGAH